MKIREISEQTSTDKPVKSKLGQMMAPTPVPKSLTQEPGKDSYARDVAGLLPGVGTALDVKDIAGGDYSGAPYMALGLLPGGGLLKKGAKKLRKFLGKADDVADAAPRVTPPKAPEVTPPKAPEPRGEIDLKQEFKRIEAERVAKAEAEAAERAAEAAKKLDLEKAAEAERLKNIKLPRERPYPIETDKGFIRRLEKMGPEYAAKHRQEVQTLKAMQDLKAGSPANILKNIGGGALKYGGIGTGAALGYKYGPDVTDWALGKGIGTIQDIDTSNSNLPFPASSDTPVKPPDAAPDTSSNQNSTDTSDTPVKPPDNSDSGESPRSKRYGDQSRAPGKETSLTEKQEKYSKDQYIDWAAKYARIYDVPVSVVLHAMYKETGWMPNADSMRTARNPRSGATGVMQILPQYSKDYGINPNDLTNPEKNIQAGARMLAKHYNTFGDADAALAAYNWGPNSKQFKQWVQTRDVKLLPSETRKYIYGDPKKKDSVAYTDDPKIQLAALKPDGKLAAAATNVLSTLVGAGDAQATEKITPVQQSLPNDKLRPFNDRIANRMQELSPEFRKRLEVALEKYPGELRVTSANRTSKEQRRLRQDYETGKSNIPASAAVASHSGYAIDINRDDLNKFHKWLQAEKKAGNDYGLETGLEWKKQDPVHLQARGWQQIQQQEIAAKKDQEKNNQRDTQVARVEKPSKPAEKTKKKSTSKIDPITGASSAQAEPAVPAEVKPADKTPKAKTRTTTDALGRETTYTQNEKGQWVDPRGNIMPTPEKPGSRKDLSISDTGVEPSAADLEKTRKITGRSDPLIDPETGNPTTEKALRAKVEKQQRDRDASERSAGEQERKRVADLEKAQSDAAKSRADAEKPVDKLADKKAPAKVDKKDKQQRAPDAVAPAADVPAADTKAKTDVRKEFERAFATARAEKGPGESFTFTNPRTGKESTHTTNYRNEKTDKKSDSTKSDRKVDTTKSDSDVAVAPEVTPADNTIIDKLTKKDSWDTAKNTSKIDVEPDTEVPVDGPALPEVPVFGKAMLPNVWRDSSGKPVTSGTGEPIATGTSEPDDIEAAKAELQQQADAAKAKAQLQAISPDLSQPEPSSWKNIWDKGIENITGKKRMSKDELNTIRVPESINNELADILRLAGRKK